LMCCYLVVLTIVSDFFFSGRRRHTRCLSDWSSDVCSSDLPCGLEQGPAERVDGGGRDPALQGGHHGGGVRVPRRLARRHIDAREIGRASCRERVEIEEEALE